MTSPLSINGQVPSNWFRVHNLGHVDWSMRVESLTEYFQFSKTGGGRARDNPNTALTLRKDGEL